MHEINRYGKIVVNEKEVYYGCITEINFETQLAKLNIIDWRDKEKEPKQFNEMIVPTQKFTIKFEAVQ